MNILINALSAKKGGGLIYLNNLIYYLDRIIKKDIIFLLVSKYNKSEFQKRNLENVILVETGVSNIMHRLYYEQCIIPSIVKNRKIDILYSPAEILSFFSPCYKILGLQNTNIYYKNKIKRSFKEKVRLYMLYLLSRLSLKKADKIITVSNEFASQVSKNMNISESKIRRIYHGIDIKKFKNEKKLGSDYLNEYFKVKKESFLLCISNIHPHKNIVNLIKGYSKLPERIRNVYKLVIVGRKNTRYFQEIKNKYSSYEIKDNIIFTGIIPHEKISFFYKRAVLFVLPSILEAFGLPLLEAMASGTPIIAANSIAIPEILGGAGILFNPNNPEELAEKIQLVLKNENLQRELIKKGYKRVKQFSWEKTARETLKVFEEVANGK